MKTKSLNPQNPLICVILVLTFLFSCSRTTTYSRYYNPQWMNDGRIICVREAVTQESGTGMFGTGSGAAVGTNYLTIMNADGTGEYDILALGVETFAVPNVSPKGNYVMIGGGKKVGSESHSGIIVYQFDSVTHKLVESSFIALEDVGGFSVKDWSPDESKIVVQTYTGGVRIYQRTGELVRVLGNIDIAPVWKYNENIIGYPKMTEISPIRMVSPEDVIVTSNLGANVAKQYFPDGKSYFGNFNKVSVPDFQVIATYEDLKAVLEGMGSNTDDYHLVYNPINPVTPNQVMITGPRYETLRTEAFGQGIWLINLDGTNKIVVKQR